MEAMGILPIHQMTMGMTIGGPAKTNVREKVPRALVHLMGAMVMTLNLMIAMKSSDAE